MKTVTLPLLANPFETTGENQPNYEKMSKHRFAEAIDAINNGKIFESISAAKEALIYAKYAQSYQRVYIHGFLAMLHLDLKKFNNARIHCWHAQNDLDENHRDHDTDLAYYVTLSDEIEKQAKRWRRKRKNTIVHA